jgi:NADH-quinone oxidoreductase subunit M
MYMLNHGLSTGALFFCVGMIYERFGTKQFADFSGLVNVMPVWAFFTVFFVLSSVALPGLNGFVGELLTLLGAFASVELLGWRFAALAAAGIIVAAIYLLYMVGRAVFGPLKLPDAFESDRPRDLGGREITVLAPIAVLCLVLGLYPWPVLQSLEEPVAQLTQPARTQLADRRPPTAPLNPEAQPGARSVAAPLPGPGPMPLATGHRHE